MLAKVPQERVAALIASGRSANLRALLQKAGLPPKTFPAFAAAIDVIRNGDPHAGGESDYRRATHLIDAIVTRYPATRRTASSTRSWRCSAASPATPSAARRATTPSRLRSGLALGDCFGVTSAPRRGAFLDIL